MKRTIALLASLLIVYMHAVDAAPTVAPGFYSFGSCGGIKAGEYTAPGSGHEMEFRDRHLCKETYEGFGPGQCHATADFYRQELYRDGKGEQVYKKCEPNIEIWEEDCKRFVRQAAKQCETLKTTEQFQEGDNRSSPNERTSAKDKFADMLNSQGPAVDENYNSEKIKAENAAARHDKLEQARKEDERERQEFLVRRQQAEYERQAELARQQAEADADSSGNSSNEVLETLGTVLMGVAQGVAAVNGQSLNVHNFNAHSSSSGYSGSRGHCPPGYNFHPGGPYTKRGCFSIETRKWVFPAQ